MSKKIIKIFIMVLIVVGVISILLFNSKDYVDIVGNAINDTKIMKLYDYKTNELILEYSKDDTKELIKDLDYPSWKETNKLNGDERLYNLKLYTDEDTEDIGIITIYTSMDYVEVKINNSEETKIYKTDKNPKKIFKLNKKNK